MASNDVTKLSYCSCALFDSELAYLALLSILAQDFLESAISILQKDDKKAKAKTTCLSVLQTMQQRVKAIHKLHEERVFPALQQFIKEEDMYVALQNISKRFIAMASSFQEYALYLSTYETAVEYQLEVDSNNQLLGVLLRRSFRYEQEEVDYLTLMLCPAQRLSQYVLVLEELKIHLTNESSLEYILLETAADKMRDMVTTLSEEHRHQQNMRRTLEIESCIVNLGRVTDKLTLIHPRRRHVCDGNFMLHNGSANLQPVVLFLFNDLVILGKPFRSRADRIECIMSSLLIELTFRIVQLRKASRGSTEALEMATIANNKSYLMSATNSEVRAFLSTMECQKKASESKKNELEKQALMRAALQAEYVKKTLSKAYQDLKERMERARICKLQEEAEKLSTAQEKAALARSILENHYSALKDKGVLQRMPSLRDMNSASKELS